MTVRVFSQTDIPGPMTEPTEPRETQSDETDAAIEVTALTHTYPAASKRGRRQSRRNGEADHANDSVSTPRAHALDDVSLTIRRGEIFGILGPNGSGKSTLFRILSTVLKPSGPVDALCIMGLDVLSQSDEVRRQLGVVFQSPSLDVKLTARENLLHQGHLYGLGGESLTQRSSTLLEYFDLSARADEYVERFSGGMRRRVELAKALLHDPALLLLDEPATGLDPGARHDLWQQLLQLRSERGQTVALTTHLMDEADRCDRLAVLSEGRVVAVDTPAALKQRIGGDVLTLTPPVSTTSDELHQVRDDIEQRFSPWPADRTPVCVAGRIRLERAEGAQFVRELTDAYPNRFASISVGQPTLEDVYLHLTGHTLWQER